MNNGAGEKLGEAGMQRAETGGKIRDQRYIKEPEKNSRAQPSKLYSQPWSKSGNKIHRSKKKIKAQKQKMYGII